MTPMLNITLSDIKDLNVAHKVNKGGVKVWVRNKRDFNPNFISCETLIYLVKGTKSVVLDKYP